MKKFALTAVAVLVVALGFASVSRANGFFFGNRVTVVAPAPVIQTGLGGFVVEAPVTSFVVTQANPFFFGSGAVVPFGSTVVVDRLGRHSLGGRQVFRGFRGGRGFRGFRR